MGGLVQSQVSQASLNYSADQQRLRAGKFRNSSDAVLGQIPVYLERHREIFAGLNDAADCGPRDDR